MTRTFFAILTISLALCCATVPVARATPTEDFHALLDDHWQAAVREQVFFRSDPDAWRMHGKLAEFTPEAYARRQRFNEKMLTRLDAIDAHALAGPDRVSYRVFRYERLTERDSYAQLDRYFPINALFGYHSYFAEAPASMAFLAPADYADYLVSLADFPRYNREHIALMRAAIERGATQYCASMRKADATISRSIVDDPTDSTLYVPFENFPRSVSAGQRETLAAKGAALIADEVVPAYRALLDFYYDEYLPHCRKTAGVSSIPGGEDYYRYLVRYFTTTEMTPAEIHELGKQEVERIRGEMDAIIESLHFDGDFAGFLGYLRNEPEFYAKSADELLGRSALIAKTAEGQLPRFFGVLPRGTYDIRSSAGRGAFYMPSSGDGKTSGTYFVGTDNLRAQPLYGLEALTMHEGVPGHHVQVALAFELDLPEFRRHLAHSAFGEGWGLYAERLGKEMGFYQDPYSDFGRLTYEAWRACRLVVDTGMHAFGWSRQQAIDYMLTNTGLTQPEVENEIDRYITWPGQALAYKIGEIRIRRLRQRAEDALGEHFDLRRFHDAVLGNGSLPIDVLDELVGEWLAAEQFGAATRP